jgi:hypothetical protein
MLHYVHFSRRDSLARFVSILVALVGIAVPAMAATYGGGAGTSANPYLIYTSAQLNDIGANQTDWGKSFKLMADINLSGYSGTQFNLIGSYSPSNPFTGTFDGNRHTISNFTYATTASRSYTAMFVYTSSSAVIKDLGLVSASLTTSSPTAALVGLNMGSITSCSANVAIIVTGYGASALVVDNYGSITNSFATGSVSGLNTSGFVYGQYSGSVLRCYAAVSQTTPGWPAGMAQLSQGGSNSGCFYDSTLSGTTQSYIGTAKTTTQMKTLSTYSGWDWATTWFMCSPSSYYPRLRWTLPVGEVACPDGVSFADFAYLAAWWQYDCGSDARCLQADMDHSNIIDEGDLAILASHWLQGI